MLLLTRHIGQTIMIGDDIQITVLGIRGSNVKIGIAAPDDVPVHREEVYERTNLEIDNLINSHHLANSA